MIRTLSVVGCTLLVLFVSIEGFTTPKIPKIPDVPEIPSIPSIPEIPSIPDIPEIPSIPKIPSIPEIPSIPDVPEIPSIPSIPGFNFTNNTNLLGCGSYTGTKCRDLFASPLILAPSISSPVIDALITGLVTAIRRGMGSAFTAQCRDLVTDIQCIAFLIPCMDRVWCSDLSLNDLQQRARESCQCPSNSPQCEQFVSGFSETVGNLTRYYKTDQAPSNATCQVVNLGDSPTSGASSNTGVTLIGSLITTILVTIGAVML